jgi:hypothetical protein
LQAHEVSRSIQTRSDAFGSFRLFSYMLTFFAAGQGPRFACPILGNEQLMGNGQKTVVSCLSSV